MREGAGTIFSPRKLFTSALSLLGPPPSSSMLPLTVSWRSRSALRGAFEKASVAGIAAYVVPNTGPVLDCTYTDGSRLGSPPVSGASAVLPDGRIVLCRIPGHPNSCKAEVIGILLGSYFPLLNGSGDTLAMYTRSGPMSMQNMVPPYSKPPGFPTIPLGHCVPRGDYASPT